MSTFTIEMDEILAVEGQSSVQQSAQLQDPNLFKQFSQAVVNYSGNSQNSTEEFRILDLEKYLNDASKSSEVNCIHYGNTRVSSLLTQNPMNMRGFFFQIRGQNWLYHHVMEGDLTNAIVNFLICGH